MSFGHELWVLLVIKRESKVAKPDLPEGKYMKEVDIILYNYLEDLLMDKTVNDAMKSQISEEYVRYEKKKKLCRSKLNSGYLILCINTCVVKVGRCDTSIVEGT